MANTDTIAALATAAGSGGIGIIRLSGPNSLTVARQRFQLARPGPFQPRYLHYGRFVDSRDQALDNCLLAWFPAPASFTGEEVVELHCHGGPALLQAILAELLDLGARQAEPGEFTRRAFLNGKLDLTQAEAVAELIAAPNPEGAKLALSKLEGGLGRKIDALREQLEYLRQRVCLAIDFPEEEGEHLPPEEFSNLVQELEHETASLLKAYERARPWRDGALVVLAGQVNVGKSSLLNALLGRPRAIVTPLPGTTRDYLEELALLDGLPVRLVDTAGLRNSPDPIEQEGIRLGRNMAAKADLTLLILDGTIASQTDLQLEQELAQQLGQGKYLLVWNKADLTACPWTSLWGQPVLQVSAQTGQGLDQLTTAMRQACSGQEPETDELAPNLRQARLLEQTLAELAGLRLEIAAKVPPDLCNLRLEAAFAFLAEITGLNSAEQTLNSIFDNFCIGK